MKKSKDLGLRRPETFSRKAHGMGNRLAKGVFHGSNGSNTSKDSNRLPAPRGWTSKSFLLEVLGGVGTLFQKGSDLPGAKVIGILALFFTLVYGGSGGWFILLCVGIGLGFEYFFEFRKNRVFGPYTLMIFSPVLLLNYSSITDFRIRVLSFILLIYVFNAAYKKSVRGIRFSLLKAKPVAVWVTAWVIFALAAAAVYIQGVHLSGDEPHYLMITQSLVEDGDFDLKNNLEEKTYYKYLPVDLRFHGGEYNGRYLSFHLPGVSFLLIPFYWIYQVLGVGKVIPSALYFRLAAAVINAFFALGLFYVLKRKFPGRDITGFWLMVLCLYPLVIHAIHLYPELPAAALMMGAYLFIFLPGAEPSGVPGRNYLAAGLLLSLVPWFHVKYLPALVVLAAAILYRIFVPGIKNFCHQGTKAPRHQGRVTGEWPVDSWCLRVLVANVMAVLHKAVDLGRGAMKILLFMVFPVVSFILLVIYSKTLYGTYNPAGVFPKEGYWGGVWLLRLKVFLAYFLDQRDGLLLYAPLFFLFFFSLKKKLEHKYLLLGMAFAYVFFHAVTTVRGAYAPAGRPLIFISWIFIIFIAQTKVFGGSRPLGEGGLLEVVPGVTAIKTMENFFRNRPPVPRAFFKKVPWPPEANLIYRFLVGMSVFVVVWMFYYPLFVYQPVYAGTVEGASGFNLFLGSDNIPLWRYFPSFLTHPLSAHPANYVWIGLLVTAIFIYYIKPFKPLKKPGSKPITAVVLFILFLGAAFLYCFYPHVHLVAQNLYTDRAICFYNSSKNFQYAADEKHFRIKAGNKYDIFIDRRLKRKEEVRLRFANTEVVGVTVRNGRRVLWVSKAGGEREKSFLLRISSLRTLRVKGKWVSHLGIETDSREGDVFLWLSID